MNAIGHSTERAMLEDFRLRVFKAVAETGSFTKASRQVGISQPAVSQHISTLEKEVGTALFQRNKGEVVLTGAGRVFLEYADKIQYWYSATSRMFGENGQVTSRTPVRISADPVVSSYMLPAVLAKISDAQPGWSFSVLETGSAEQADVAVTLTPSPKLMDFEGERKLVGVMDAMVVSSPANRTVSGAAVHGENDDLMSKPFSTIAGIPVANKFAVWSGYDTFFTPDLRARTVLLTDSVEAIKSMVEESGRVVGIVPAISVRKELNRGSLLQMPVSLPDFMYDIHFDPVPEFGDREICKLLRNILKDSL